jgi:hypothetical protein
MMQYKANVWYKSEGTLFRAFLGNHSYLALKQMLADYLNIRAMYGDTIESVIVEDTVSGVVLESYYKDDEGMMVREF